MDPSKLHAGTETDRPQPKEPRPVTDTPATEPEPEPENLWTPKRTAEFLGVSQRTIYVLTVVEQVLPCIRINKLVRYDPADVRAFVEARKQTGQAGK
ncbi:MAG: helix-turn-helix domain-containing protein [Phycisphaerae bacterium]|nr:helix-turn-helix domain-containing protein [Phycisphaerae bacterium]